MSQLIRYAETKDLSALRALDAECFPPGRNDLQPAALGEIEKGLETRGIFVVEDDGAVVGFLQVDKQSGEDWELLSLAISQNQRSKGLGRKLLGQLVADRVSGSERIYTVTAPQNLPMQRLLLSFGFREVEYLPDHFGPGKHRVKFELS
jgi:[ribosomal protein S18]-alanine N-acetyltransferase